MEKAAIAPHKSHMSSSWRLAAARVSRDAGGRRVASSAGLGAGTAAGSGGAGAVCDGRRAAGRSQRRPAETGTCTVDASGGRGPDAWQAGGTARRRASTAEAVTPVSLTTSADDGVRLEIRLGTRAAVRLAVRQGVPTTLPARESGVQLPARGTQRKARRGAFLGPARSLCDGIGKGQGAYFPADGTGVKRTTGIAPLSHCERPTRAQDLLTTTCSNVSCT
jgi:hypothetical protein